MSKELVVQIYRVTDAKIEGFFGEHRFLSNFHEEPFNFEGLRYGSSEAAYQASKCESTGLMTYFTTLSPAESKKAGQKVKLRPDWEDIKEDVMERILLAKFTQSPELRTKLLATGDKYLEETNWWGDRYWGVCNSSGRNRLGVILMFIRKKLREETGNV